VFASLQCGVDAFREQPPFASRRPPPPPRCLQPQLRRRRRAAAAVFQAPLFRGQIFVFDDFQAVQAAVAPSSFTMFSATLPSQMLTPKTARNHVLLQRGCRPAPAQTPPTSEDEAAQRGAAPLAPRERHVTTASPAAAAQVPQAVSIINAPAPPVRSECARHASMRRKRVCVLRQRQQPPDHVCRSNAPHGKERGAEIALRRRERIPTLRFSSNNARGSLSCRAILFTMPASRIARSSPIFQKSRLSAIAVFRFSPRYSSSRRDVRLISRYRALSPP